MFYVVTLLGRTPTFLTDEDPDAPAEFASYADAEAVAENHSLCVRYGFVILEADSSGVYDTCEYE